MLDRIIVKTRTRRGKTFSRKSIKTKKGYMQLSRYLANKFIRPFLPVNSKEIVHHKDEDTMNDSLDNLEILKWGAHTSHHVSGKKHPMYNKKHSKEAIERMKTSHKGKIPWNRGERYKEFIKRKKLLDETSNNLFLHKDDDTRFKLTFNKYFRKVCILFNNNLSTRQISKEIGIGRNRVLSIMKRLNLRRQKGEAERLKWKSQIIKRR